MAAPKAHCYCFYTQLPAPNALHRRSPQRKVIQRTVPGSRELQGPLGNSPNRESNPASGCPSHTGACTSPPAVRYRGPQPLAHHVGSSRLAVGPLTAPRSSAHSTAHENTGTSSSAKPSLQPRYRKNPARLQTVSSTWRPWLVGDP